MYPNAPAATTRAIWNKGKLVGQKPPLKVSAQRTPSLINCQECDRRWYYRAAKPRSVRPSRPWAAQ